MTSSKGLAWAALALTIIIWAGFLVSTRAAVTQSLGAVEVGLMRYGPAILLFLPVLIKHGPVPKGAGVREVVLIALMGGLVFILLLGNGMRFAPVADSGVFTPSSLPFFVAVLSALFLAERFTRLRLVGFSLIVLGALVVGGWEALSNASSGAWRGHILFLSASFCWAVYTIAYRRSGIGAMPAAAMIAFWSGFGFILVALVWGVDFSQATFGFVALQTLLQGVLSGYVATITYFYAVTHIGASRTAAFAALVPILAAIGGWVFLDEPIGILKAIGIAVVAAGVVLASGALPYRSSRA